MPVGFVGVVVEVGHVDAAFGGHEVRGGGGDPDDADRVGGGIGGGGGEDGLQEFGEEEGGDVVGAELEFVALLGRGALGGDHDAGVVPEDVEAVIVFEEGVCGCFDGGEVVEVEVERVERAGGFRGAGLDGGDGIVDLGYVACCDVDFGVMKVEDVG